MDYWKTSTCHLVDTILRLEDPNFPPIIYLHLHPFPETETGFGLPKHNIQAKLGQNTRLTKNQPSQMSVIMHMEIPCGSKLAESWKMTAFRYHSCRHFSKQDTRIHVSDKVTVQSRYCKVVICIIV